jgi:hypothetical protein
MPEPAIVETAASYEPFPETMIEEGKTSHAPDLILFAN